MWGKANADSAEQVERVSKALDTLEAAFLNMVRTGTTPNPGFADLGLSENDVPRKTQWLMVIIPTKWL